MPCFLSFCMLFCPKGIDFAENTTKTGVIML